MQCHFHIVLIVAWAVAMVTSAPLSTQEKLVNVEQAGDQVNRAKRADEEIVFGNQQNKARVVAKKSDLSNILAPAQLPGEVDQGSEVIVHKELPVTEDLASRAEAAAGSVSENNEKIKEAVEAALQSVAEDKAEISDSADAGQESVEKSKTDDNASKQLASEDTDEENEQGTGEISDAVEENAPDAVGDDEDEALKELQRAAEGNAAAAQGSDGSNGELFSLDDSNEGDETERFLQESQKPEDEGEVSLDRDRERAYVNQMRNYLMSMRNGRGYHRLNPFLFRYRRSLDFSRKNMPSKNNKRTRRIKRDLVDDRYYGPYELPYIPSEYRDLNSDSEDFVPLTDDEAEYVYKQLVNYLANDYTPEQEEPEREPEEGSLDSYLNGYEQDENEPYAPYVTYNEDSVPYTPRVYEDKYQYGPHNEDAVPYAPRVYEDKYQYGPHNEDAVPYAPRVYEDKYQYGPLDVVGLAKRGLVDYYPYEEEEKRYFFPFNKEPETHWGAFVPEKRDYDEAIQRLQRLAMALSDNPGPYYREILEEYRRK